MALAAHGVPQLTGDTYAASEGAVVVHQNSVPQYEDLIMTGVSSGPPAWRPPATGSAGNGAVHLCEAVACRLPMEDFWKSKPNGKAVH